ncbi:hypothetical protein EN858_21735 [Mesorhizobium sp. M4B.F.Ca.ET.215.01.1.1]|uniref:hypothetical protein n=1 Tax=unclassified Mesorhizobium TaxID=325217 RepID=UPI000FCAC448|nr:MULTISPECIES: hypothetical protein [unclassified Mesorhizobium]RVD33018.1 hypothetical protein EN741_32890 [Mesorhizobium sp. M4B.F.Ca.ET.019.03.1.1]TGQ08358.1 hypothetical protein EN858_21735 [Mesorhizobium sp. M4B.F.Ca.ET.215.01.1.1]TGQ41065.1 hypothetical protein EN863_021870 [Mesorhizobium sp. M00.F.Ca.ET.220.01.1.1]TGR01915.1 hypothetical protein EN846_18595 [Mesorhizobium sp. M4B.F.Ca.ET.203.01.1.1]TGT45400.1 hypothetical protein EN812_09685 [Mesorhizobium sp. M4B.F.Ca.ET.169.01.1.1]
MRIILAGLCLLIGLFIVALVATSSAVLLKQEKAADGYLCKYFTGTATYSTPSYATTGCPRFIIVKR